MDKITLRLQQNKAHVVFDFDGVIVDTAGTAYNILAQIIDKYFSDASFDKRSTFDKICALDLESITKFLINNSCGFVKEDSLVDILEDYRQLWALSYKSTNINSEFFHCLEFLKAFGCRVSIATSSQKNHVLSIIPNANELFSAIYDCDSIPYSKVDYRFWQHIKEEYSEYKHFVIEDNSLNIKAATKVGYHPIFYNFKASLISTLYASFIENDFTSQYIKASDFAIETETINIDEETKNNTNLKWNEVVKENPLAFDGPLSFCSNVSLQNDLLIIKGSDLSYKFRMLDLPSLLSVAVQCYIVNEHGKYLTGQRKSSLGMEGNCYEFVPSGGVEKLSKSSIIKQIKKEMLEETQINFEEIKASIHFKGYIIDIKNKLIDLVYEIKVVSTNNTLEKPAKNQEEHSGLQWLDLNFIQEHSEKLTTSSALIANHLSN